MSKITDFLRKIGLLQASKGDATTGEFDSREDLKQPEETQEEEKAPEEVASQPESEQEAPEMPEEPKQQM